MNTKTFTAKELGEWIACFRRFSSPEQYQNEIHAMRVIFDAENDPEFWEEACRAAKAIIKAGS